MRWQSPGSIGQGRDRGAQVSKQLINEYRAELDRLRVVSGSRREGVLSEAVKDLLMRCGSDSIQNGSSLADVYGRRTPTRLFGTITEHAIEDLLR